MAEIVGFAETFAGALAEVAPVLDERARRLLMGAAARQLGRGGITLIAAATGASKDTVGRGAGELEAGVVVDGRIRATGAGRKLVEHHDPGLWPALDELVDPETRGIDFALRCTKSRSAGRGLASQVSGGADRWSATRTTTTACRATPSDRGQQHPDATPVRYLTPGHHVLTAGLPVIAFVLRKEPAHRPCHIPSTVGNSEEHSCSMLT